MCTCDNGLEWGYNYEAFSLSFTHSLTLTHSLSLSLSLSLSSPLFLLLYLNDDGGVLGENTNTHTQQPHSLYCSRLYSYLVMPLQCRHASVIISRPTNGLWLQLNTYKSVHKMCTKGFQTRFYINLVFLCSSFVVNKYLSEGSNSVH